MKSTSRPMTSRLALPASGLIALCAFVHACGGGGGGGGGGSPPAPSPGPGPTSFVVTSQFPANSAVDVARQPIILIRFNDTVNPATMSATTVQLLQGATPVASTLSFNACNNSIQLIPNAALAPGLPFTVSLTAGLRDDDGEALTASTFGFTTTANGDAERPIFSMVGLDADPNPGSETNQIMLNWSDASDNIDGPTAIRYRVFVSTNSCFDFSSPATLISGQQITAPGDLSAIVPGLTSRTLHSVVIRAVDSAGNESTNTTPINVSTFTSFAGNIWPIVSTFCQSCHNPPAGQAVVSGVDMDYSTPATTYNSWVNDPDAFCATAGAGNPFANRVEPGDANSSFLWNKISGEPSGVVCGSQMPLGLPPLADVHQEAIFDWINEGALDN